ncbi:DUF4241 domain-containing protein [Nostocoides australiense]
MAAGKPLFERDDAGEMDWGAFDTWQPLIEEVTARHTTPGTSLGLGGSFGGETEYDPARETLVATRTDGDRSLVRTARDVSFGAKTREYELILQQGDWRLQRINEYYDDPDDPFCQPDALQLMVARTSTDAPLPPLPAVDRAVDFAQLFAERDVVDGDGDESRVEVRSVGSFTSDSGILTVVDFGYEATMLEPVQRRVEPGCYAVDVAGVDAGNLAVLDLPAYGSVTVRDKERAYDEFVLNPDQDSGLLLAFGRRPPIGAVSSSGWGDGAYPVYWGADASGRPVQLVIDYLVLSRALEQERVIPWADGVMTPPELAASGMTVRTETERKLLRSTTRLVVENPNDVEHGVAVIDDRGRQVEIAVGNEDEDDVTICVVSGRPAPGWTVQIKASLGRTLI